MDAPEGTEVRAERRASPFTGVTMDFTLAITVIIPRPFAYAMADGGMGRMTAPVALPFVGVQPRAVSWDVFIDEATAVCLSAWSPTQKRCYLCCFKRRRCDGGPIVRIGAVAFALIGPSMWRVTGITMGRAFFPRVWYSSSASNAVPGHHLRWCGIVQVRLHALAQRVQLLAGHPQLTG